MSTLHTILTLGEKVLAGTPLERQEASQLAATPDADLPFLLAMADRIRQQYQGDTVDLCSILNGRSGRCSENCSFCAQSAHFETGVKTYRLLTEDELVDAAKAAEAHGALRFSIVTSGRGMETDQDFPRILAAYRRIRQETSLKLCASLGTLSPENARALKEAGVERYHHNIESSRGYYPTICTTHDFDARTATIHVAHEAGLEVCAGGILGLGETMEDRLDMAFELRDLKVHSVPLNILKIGRAHV